MLLYNRLRIIYYNNLYKYNSYVCLTTPSKKGVLHYLKKRIYLKIITIVIVSK